MLKIIQQVVLVVACFVGIQQFALSVSQPPKVLVLSGSARSKSVNKILAETARTIAQEAGSEATFIDPASLSIPLYDGDMEENEGFPADVTKLKQQIDSADLLIIASPEYNGFFTPLLKNHLDWTSRPQEKGEKSSRVFKNKKVLLLSASPSPAGGADGLLELEKQMANLGSVILPKKVSIGKATPSSIQSLLAPDSPGYKAVKEAVQLGISSIN